MTTTRSENDQPARVRAATDTATNLVVSAGAGTGKTSLLVERVLNAIGTGTATLPAIAAITFTDKAAGELRHRVASGLDELRARARRRPTKSDDTPAARAFAYLEAEGVDAETIERRAAGAIFGLDRAAISTIHGFCSDLLRSHPIEAGISPVFAVDSGIALRRLAARPWTEFVEQELGPGGTRRDLWTRVLDTISLDEAQSIARALASGAVPDDVLEQGIPAPDLRAVLGETAARWAGALGAAAATPGLADSPRDWLLEGERVMRALADAGVVAARTAIATAKRLGNSKPSLGVKVSPEDKARILDLAARVAPLIKGLAALDEPRVADVMAALLPFVTRLRATALRAGQLDFPALLVRARDLLRDVPEVRRAVKRRFRMILVDEFQDTDPLQYEIVFFAAEDAGDEVGDAYAARLAPGRLFIVGDAKQSIYRFRGADYAAYRRAVEHVLEQGGAELSLTTNYRSTRAVLEPINALFSPPASPSWAPSEYLPVYEPIVAHRHDAAAIPAVEVWTPLVPSDATAAQRRRVEGWALAAGINDAAGPAQALEYSDVLVLFRGFTEVGLYLRALREAGVPFVVSGGRTFFERTEIVQAMAVLRAVADPDDRVALLAYLRSPAGGVSDRELAAHAAAKGAWTLSASVDARACPTLEAALVRLRALGAGVASRPVDEIVRRVVRDSGLLPLSGLAFEAAQRVVNLEKLMLAAGTMARDGRMSLTETLDAIEEGFEADEEGDSPLADETTDAVRVMTIHKAKGLEAKLVILADAAADVGNRRRSDWKAEMASLPAGDLLRLDGPSLRNGASVAATLEDDFHERGERIRLLYVALTRAKDRLVVFGGGTRSSPWIAALAAWGYDPDAPPADDQPIAGGAVLHRLVEAPRRTARAAAPQVSGTPDAVARYEAAVVAVTTLAAPPFRSPSRFAEREAHDAEPSEGAPAPDLAREVGNVVHARLAGISLAPTNEAIDKEVEEVMAAFRASPLASRLATLDVLGREVPLLFGEGESRWRGVVDLIYRDADGTIVVADYKTDTSVDGAVERHAPQLGVYVRALERAMPGTRVRAELWMLRSGTILAL